MLRKSNSMTWVPWAWDPLSGCTRISEGCDNCIARWQRIKLSDKTLEEPDFKPTIHRMEFRRPLEEHTEKSMIVVPRGDLFHVAFPFIIIHELLDVMRKATQHTYYLLTKRPLRMLQCLMSYRHWPLPRVNVGVSAENQQRLEERLPVLLGIPVHETAHRYLECEPMLGPIAIGAERAKLGAVICAAERGAKKRLFRTKWLETLKTECAMAGISFCHHGSGIVDQEQRPTSDHEVRKRQCMTRLREYRSGYNSLLVLLKDVMDRESISFQELTRRIGPAAMGDRCRLAKGIINEGTRRKVTAFLTNYYKINGGADETRCQERTACGSL